MDGILYGVFSTPVPTWLPGPEEYWNGASESGNSVTDDRCASQAIHPTAGGGAIADVTFNKVKGAPEFIPIELPNSSIAELSGDGQVTIGYSDWGLIRWTPSTTDIIGGDYRSPQMAISHDGRTLAASTSDADGNVVAGIWMGCQESIVHQEPALCCDWDGCLVDTAGEAGAVNPDGSIILGDYYAVSRVYEDPWSGDVFHYCESVPWKFNQSTGLAESIGGYLPENGLTTHAFDLSDNGGVIVGRADPFDWGLPVPVMWTAPTGWIDFQAFLAAQGTYAQDWVLATPGTISGDGTVVGGWGYSPFSRQGWIVNMPKIVICHAPPGNPSNKKTKDVAWPDGLASHLAHGDTIGQCGNGQ